MLAAGLAAATCTLALAACGSSTKLTGTSTGASGGNSSKLAWAECMRAHGMPTLPDPSAGGGINIPSGMVQSPAFQSASQVCRKRLPGGGPRGGIAESVKLSMLHHAECMRAHGVTNYPDPTIPSHGPIWIGPPPGINTNAPAFKHAAAACGGA